MPAARPATREQAHMTLDLSLHIQDVTEDMITHDAKLLAGLPQTVLRNGDPLMALGLALDAAACIEADDTVSLVYVELNDRSLGGADEVTAVIDLLVKSCPVLGPEVVYCWSHGLTRVLFNHLAPVEESYAWRRQEGLLSNHEILEMRAEAARKITPTRQ